MKVIELTRGQVAIVDDEDFEELAQYRWNCNDEGYAIRTCRATGRKVKISMHRIVLSKGMTFEQRLVFVNQDADHKNGNKSDNRKENLRVATRSQNCCNKGKRSDNKLGLKGVHLHKGTGKFQAAISLRGRRKYLGLFDTAKAAHLAYSTAAKELHGEFVRLN